MFYSVYLGERKTRIELPNSVKVCICQLSKKGGIPALNVFVMLQSPVYIFFHWSLFRLPLAGMHFLFLFAFPFPLFSKIMLFVGSGYFCISSPVSASFPPPQPHLEKKIKIH